MTYRTVTESLRAFLTEEREKVSHQDMIDRLLEDGMEIQINVLAGDGERVPGRNNTWTDGNETWWAIRIPKNAKTDPYWKDYLLRWSLEKHVESIGTTGWNWKDKVSLIVGFDFDAITGHAAGIGVDEAKLAEIERKARELPYVEVRRSTSGNGLHLFVHLDRIPTENHTIHQALGRAVLQMMSEEAGFDFASAIDACGSNMWHYSVRATKENRGFELLKKATKKLSEAGLPQDWRANLDVVTRRRAKVKMANVPETEEELFEAMASAHPPIALNAAHEKHMQAIADLGYSGVWVSDHNLFQTHTCALKELCDDTDPSIKGVFATNSPGTDKASPNCFMFPMANGGWRVQRFSIGCRESETWNHQEGTYTWCYFNRPADLRVAAKAAGGAELENNKGFQFRDMKDTIRVFENLGSEERVTEKYHGRIGEMAPSKDGRLVVRVNKAGTDEPPEPGWASKRGYFQKVFDVKAIDEQAGKETANLDECVRSLVTTNGSEAGWVLKADNGNWNRHSKDNVKSALKYLGHSKEEADRICGGAVMKSWTLVNLPFQSEFPGNRQWNMDGAQYRFTPAAEPGEHPHWDMILNHIGSDLDAYLPELDWAVETNILTGYQYLLTWIACLLRKPFDPLPYLFLFSADQNTGKSIFHEGLSLLMTKGCVSADRALTNQNDFNGELAGAILCYVEEKDLSAAGKMAYNRIKDWCTSKSIWIRKMRTDAYEQPNTTHWIQGANDSNNCPVFPGDTRITAIQVPFLIDEIPKSILLEQLEKEAPAFMRTILDLDLPKVYGRLRLPIVNTDHKDKIAKSNLNEVEQFLNDDTFEVPGELIPFKDFYDRFIEQLPSDQKFKWSKPKVVRALPDDIAYGAGNGNSRYIGNRSWEPMTESQKAQPPYVVEKGRLVRDKAAKDRLAQTAA